MIKMEYETTECLFRSRADMISIGILFVLQLQKSIKMPHSPRATDILMILRRVM